MASPKYVVKHIGGEYRIIRTDAAGVMSSGALTMVGAAALGIGILRRSWFGAMGAMLGSGLIYYAMTGDNPVRRIYESFNRKPLKESAGPSHQHDMHIGSQQRPQDQVDEASMESFPASDAPASTRSTATVPGVMSSGR